MAKSNWERYVQNVANNVEDPFYHFNQTNTTPITNPSGDTELNVCCPCIDCLDYCIEFAESSWRCNPPNTDLSPNRTPDCGPHQVDPVNYVSDICSDCRPEIGSTGKCSDGSPVTQPGWCCNCTPCGDCNVPDSNPNGLGRCCYDASCCEVCEEGYGNMLCEDCTQHSDGGYDACCAEKKRRSRKLIRCYRRRWTRNQGNSCPGSGGVLLHPDDPLSGPCYTCEDLARMHQGGNCGHINPTAKNNRYWKTVSKCMKEHCNYTKTQDGTESCRLIETRGNDNASDFWSHRRNMSNCPPNYKCLQRHKDELCWAEIPKGCNGQCGSETAGDEFEFKCVRRISQEGQCIKSDGTPCLKLGPIATNPCSDPICGNSHKDNNRNRCSSYFVYNDCVDTHPYLEGFSGVTDCCSRTGRL